MTTSPVYIVDCRRTAIGSANKSLKTFDASQLVAFVIDGLIKENKMARDKVTEVVLGNAVSAGTGQNLARKAVSLSKLSIKTPAYVVNNVCGSGLQAIITSIQKILSEDAGVIIAGATESATHSPLLINKRSDEKEESLQHDGLFCSLAEQSMGDICEGLAKEEGISRKQQDEYTLETHRRACDARKNGDFKDEIIPVSVAGKESFVQDERPREKATLKKLGLLPPAFSKDGTITAGNASSAADGACAFLLASEKALEENHLVPLAKILGYASIAVEPSRVFEEGLDAIKKCLEKCSLSLEDIDIFEITEAFAAQAIFTRESLNIPEKKMNIFGGDLALGHPLGIAGSRALVTLVQALKNKKKRKGLVYTPFGAGGAIALAVEVVP